MTPTEPSDPAEHRAEYPGRVRHAQRIVDGENSVTGPHTGSRTLLSGAGAGVAATATGRSGAEGAPASGTFTTSTYLASSALSRCGRLSWINVVAPTREDDRAAGLGGRRP